MKWQGKLDVTKPITLNGKHHGVEPISTLTVWAAEDEGRVVSTEDTGKLFYGGKADWEELTPGGIGIHEHDDLYYTETEVDGLFAGEVGGKKTIEYTNVLNPPSEYNPQSHGNEKHSATYITVSDVTFASIDANGDVGAGSSQVAQGNHDHNAVYSLLGHDHNTDYYTKAELDAIADAGAGADIIGATAVGTGSAVTVQGVLEELDTKIDAVIEVQDMDDVYNEGSSVTVDDTNVLYTLSTGKSFAIGDATDANKFVVTEGNGDDSVKVITTGGIYSTGSKLDFIRTGSDGRFLMEDGLGVLLVAPADNSIQATTTGAGGITLTSAASTAINAVDQIDVISSGAGVVISGAATSSLITTSGNIEINPSGHVALQGSVVPSASVDLGATANKFQSVWTDSLDFGDTNKIKIDTGKVALSNDGTNFYEILDKNTLEAGGNVTLQWSDITGVSVAWGDVVSPEASTIGFTSAGTVVATTVTTAIDELKGEIDTINDATPTIAETTGAPDPLEDPTPPSGAFRFDPATNKLYIFNGTDWTETQMTVVV